MCTLSLPHCLFYRTLPPPHLNDAILTTSASHISIPPKVWRPKPISCYVPLDYSNEFSDDLFVFPRYGKSIQQCSQISKELPPRDDIRVWNAATDQAEFNRVIHIPSGVDTDIHNELVSIIQDNWDCFYAKGVNRPVRGFEFHIDTGSAQPVTCRPPHYGFHEGKIMQESIYDLLSNSWIRECSWPWLSKAVLAPKPHQEHVTDIGDFVWRFCVNYRPLNAVTKPYDYPIPRCDDALEDFGDSKGKLYFISVDAKFGYHQISVNEFSQEKLAFMGPNYVKYCYTVMPFGPKNSPAVYTAMITVLKNEYDALFQTRHPAKVLTVGNKNIMDDALIWSTDAMTSLQYFRCLCEIYIKKRLSFKPKKCDFLSHDLNSSDTMYGQMGTVPHPRSLISSRIGRYRKMEFCCLLFSDSSPFTTDTSRITMHVANRCVTSPSSSIGLRSQHTHGPCHYAKPSLP